MPHARYHILDNAAKRTAFQLIGSAARWQASSCLPRGACAARASGRTGQLWLDRRLPRPSARSETNQLLPAVTPSVPKASLSCEHPPEDTAYLQAFPAEKAPKTIPTQSRRLEGLQPPRSIKVPSLDPERIRGRSSTMTRDPHQKGVGQ